MAFRHTGRLHPPIAALAAVVLALALPSGALPARAAPAPGTPLQGNLPQATSPGSNPGDDFTGCQGARFKDPWPPGTYLEPRTLAARLSRGDRPLAYVIHVGYSDLYRGGHVPAAMDAGPASTPAGLHRLERLVRDWPRNQPVILYCGCCPQDQCTNVRPAYQALRDMGFTHVAVLRLKDNFVVDWEEEGYPVQESSLP